MTADNFLNKHNEEGSYNDAYGGGGVFFYREQIENMLIDFAKIHVELALKEASKNCVADIYDGVDKDSILDAYPLNKIK